MEYIDRIEKILEEQNETIKKDNEKMDKDNEFLKSISNALIAALSKLDFPKNATLA